MFSYLSFLDIYDDFEYHRKQNKIIQKIIDEKKYIDDYYNDPLEILMEKERYAEIISLIEHVKNILKPKRFNILWLYVVEGWTQEKIAKKYGVTQEAITQNLQTIYKKIQKNLIFLPSIALSQGSIFNLDMFLSNDEEEADTPKIKVKYPSDLLTNVNIGGEWRTQRGRSVYKSKSVCKLPQYFRESFGDDKTVCTLCTNDYGENHCIYKDVKT